MDVGRAFKVLDLPENASLDDVKQAWRELIIIWHPDKYQTNPYVHKRALEKTKEINEAYDFLCNYLSSRPNRTHEQPKPDIHEEYIFIVCRKCGVTNRIQERHRYGLRCGRCGAVISYSDEQKKQGDDWNQRQPCGDGICTGIIAADGRCTACGKTWEEGQRAGQYRQQSNAGVKQKRTSNKIIVFFNTKPKEALILTTFVTFLIIIGSVLFVGNTPKTIKPGPPAVAVARPPLALLPLHPPLKPLFDKPVQSLPRNGAVFRFSSGDFIVPLRVTTPSSDEHYFVKVVDYDSNTPIATMFIRTGMTAEMKVPVGSFAIKYATGKIWYGRKYLFGPKTAFFRCEDKFDFYIHGDKVRGHRIELIKQRGGNLHTSDISEDEF